jgi:peptidoglycan hydrolase-like protein with peptidoglycan-binding domain
MGQMAYWNAVGDIGTQDAYRAYLERYPQGIFADEARARVQELTQSPRDRAQQEEAALALNRNERRQIQRNLALLGFDPRGIDGVFGRGSRAAIAAWQRSAGHSDMGFLTRPQINALQRQADIRAAELEREAQLRREAEERADRQYWQQLGRDESSLRAYLDRYPDGLFATEAQANLDRIIEDRRNAAEARERAAWDSARNADTVEAYTGFLRRFPNGGFAGEARQRIAELQAEDRNAAQVERLKRIENEIVPNRGARILVEQILQTKGLKPGQVDGRFTPETRRALRRFQKEQDLTVNGYVTQKTMVVLMLSNR